MKKKKINLIFWSTIKKAGWGYEMRSQGKAKRRHTQEFVACVIFYHDIQEHYTKIGLP